MSYPTVWIDAALDGVGDSVERDKFDDGFVGWGDIAPHWEVFTDLAEFW